MFHIKPDLHLNVWIMNPIPSPAESWWVWPLNSDNGLLVTTEQRECFLKSIADISKQWTNWKSYYRVAFSRLLDVIWTTEALPLDTDGHEGEAGWVDGGGLHQGDDVAAHLAEGEVAQAEEDYLTQSTIIDKLSSRVYTEKLDIYLVYLLIQVGSFDIYLWNSAWRNCWSIASLGNTNSDPLNDWLVRPVWMG